MEDEAFFPDAARRTGIEAASADVVTVPSSQPYGDSTLAMSLAGRRDATLPPGSFVSLAAGLGVPERSARKALREIADRAGNWLPRLDQLPYDAGTIRKWRRVVDRRRQVLVS